MVAIIDKGTTVSGKQLLQNLGRSSQTGPHNHLDLGSLGVSYRVLKENKTINNERILPGFQTFVSLKITNDNIEQLKKTIWQGTE